MEIKLQLTSDNLRISLDDVFIDSEKSSCNVLSTTHYRFNYIEIRKKKIILKFLRLKIKCGRNFLILVSGMMLK